MNEQTITAKRYLIRPCTAVFISLVLLTLTTWQIGKTDLTGLSLTLIVLSIALFKGLLIGDYFMGLRGLQSFWRWVIIIWLVIPGTLITWAFFIAG